MLLISTFCIALSSALIHQAGDLPALAMEFALALLEELKGPAARSEVAGGLLFDR